MPVRAGCSDLDSGPLGPLAGTEPLAHTQGMRETAASIWALLRLVALFAAVWLLAAFVVPMSDPLAVGTGWAALLAVLMVLRPARDALLKWITGPPPA